MKRGEEHMTNLLFSTFRRLFRGKLFWLGITAMAGLGALVVLARARDNAVLPGRGYDTPDGLLFIGLTYFPIVVAVFSSLFIGAEHENGTWRNKLVVGHGKAQIYLAYLCVTTVAVLLMHIAYIGMVLGLSSILLNSFETPSNVNVVFFFCSIVTVVAINSLMVILCMLVQKRAFTAVVGVMLAIALMRGGVLIVQMLSEPEVLTWPSTIVNGVVMPAPDPTPNPKYLTGAKRVFFQFLNDFLPGGQTMTIGMTSEIPAHVWRLPIFPLC